MLKRFSNVVTISTGLPKVDNEIGKILRRLKELENYVSGLSLGGTTSALTNKHSITGEYHLGYPEDETKALLGNRTWGVTTDFGISEEDVIAYAVTL